MLITEGGGLQFQPWDVQKALQFVEDIIAAVSDPAPSRGDILTALYENICICVFFRWYFDLS
jgi:hypothetical protein